MQSPAAWVVCQDFNMAVRFVDGKCLVYHGGNGDTHMLGFEAGFVFGLLWNCKMPVSIESLLAQAKQSGFNRLDSGGMEEILNELRALQLVKTN